MREWVAEIQAPEGCWLRLDGMQPDTEEACRALINHKRSPYLDPPEHYRIRNTHTRAIVDVRFDRA